MIIRRCDRCGAECTTVSAEPVKSPFNSVKLELKGKNNKTLTATTRFDLCRECQRELWEWLHENNNRNMGPSKE